MKMISIRTDKHRVKHILSSRAPKVLESAKRVKSVHRSAVRLTCTCNSKTRARFTPGSERNLNRQLHRARLELRIKNLAETGRFENTHGWAEGRPIEHIESLDPETHRLVVCKANRAGERGIDICKSIGPERISADSIGAVREIAIVIAIDGCIHRIRLSGLKFGDGRGVPT